MKYILIFVIIAIAAFVFFTSKRNKSDTTDENPVDISDIDFPYEILIVSGKQAISECQKLRIDGAGTFTPVILGDPKELSLLLDGINESKSTPDEIIKASQKIDVEQFIARRKNGDEEYYGSVEVGHWPKNTEPYSGLTGHTSVLTSKPLKHVLICKVPTPHSWEVPAYLFYGGWNECPLAEEHVAILKYWKEKYGADIITLKGDVIECTVADPPQTPEDAIALANEQFVYCPDIVYQGAETIAALASGLKNGTTWFFWWD
jgi:hypothetical protein